MPPLVRETLPAGAVLLLAALAERSGAGAAAFYLLLAGIPVSAAAALAALGRPAATRAAAPIAPGRSSARLLVTLFTLGAAASSPVLGEVRDAAPGLASAAIVLGLRRRRGARRDRAPPRGGRARRRPRREPPCP